MGAIDDLHCLLAASLRLTVKLLANSNRSPVNMSIQHDLPLMERLLAADATLKDVVLDAQDYDGTLVALITPCIPRSRIERALNIAWEGEVEIHCATDLMMGGAHPR